MVTEGIALKVHSDAHDGTDNLMINLLVIHFVLNNLTYLPFHIRKQQFLDLRISKHAIYNHELDQPLHIVEILELEVILPSNLMQSLMAYYF